MPSVNNINKRHKRKRSNYIRQHLTTDTLSCSFKRINIVHHQRTSDNDVVSPRLRFSPDPSSSHLPHHVRDTQQHPSNAVSRSRTALVACAILVGGRASLQSAPTGRWRGCRPHPIIQALAPPISRHTHECHVRISNIVAGESVVRVSSYRACRDSCFTSVFLTSRYS